MKKLFITTALLCLLSVFAHAQYGTFTINNNTPCTVYVVLYGTVNGAVPPCQINYVSNVIAIPGTSSINYGDPGAVPGGMNNGGLTLAPGDMFTMARVYHGNPSVACTSTGVADMSDCWSGNTLIAPFDIEQFSGGGCMSCHPGGAISWVIYSPNHAGIDIN